MTSLDVSSLLSADRRRDAALLAGTALIVLLATVPFTRMAVDAWRLGSHVRPAVRGVVAAVGLNIDVAVVLPAGVYAGWLLLFVRDQSKRLQAALVALATVPFLLTLSLTGAWIGTVEWLGRAPWLVVGFIFGVATGGGHRILTGGTAEFPTAARALFVVTTLVGVVSVVESILLGPGTQPVVAAVRVLATAAFLVTLGVFVQYSDRVDVLLVSPDPVAEEVVMAGYYQSVDRRDGTAVNGAIGRFERVLQDIHADVDAGPVPTDIPGIRYQTGGWFDRWVVVGADRLSAVALNPLTFETAGASPLQRLPDPLRRGLGALLPRWVRTALADSQAAEQFASADVTLLIVPMSDPETAALFGVDALGIDPPEYLRTYRAICGARARDAAGLGTGGSEVILVAVDADAVADDYAAANRGDVTYDSAFVGWFRNTLSDQVPSDGDDTGGREGFNAADGVVILARRDATDDDRGTEVLHGADELVVAVEQ